METAASDLPAEVKAAVLKPSEGLPEGSLTVRGYDFDHGLDYRALLQACLTTGFQATSFAQAVDEVNRMIEAKLTPLSEEEDNHADLNPCSRHLTGCTIFLGFTSNLISSGVRETIRYLVQHNMVDVLVTTAGGVEEDLIKCLAPTYIGDFSLRGKELRQNGINRIGNLLVPNDNYCKFEDWLMPILDQMVTEQDTEGVKWTPSKLIARLGKEINNPESVYYWAQKNNIPVLSPALTDGSLGDMIFFHSYKKPGFVLDIVEDLRLINTQAIFAQKTGMIILGGGLVKHHIANANLMGEYFSAFKQASRREDDIAIVTCGMRVLFQKGSNRVQEVKLRNGSHNCIGWENLSRAYWEGVEGKTTARSLLADEMNLPPSVPGGMVDFQRTLVLSFFFKFYLTVHNLRLDIILISDWT